MAADSMQLAEHFFRPKRSAYHIQLGSGFRVESQRGTIIADAAKRKGIQAREDRTMPKPAFCGVQHWSTA